MHKAEGEDVSLIGWPLPGFEPLGNLGLALEPEGPAHFAVISALARDHSVKRLAKPCVLSVHGPGEPLGLTYELSGGGQSSLGLEPQGEQPAQPLRQWPMRLDRPCVRVELRTALLAQFLEPGETPS